MIGFGKRKKQREYMKGGNRKRKQDKDTKEKEEEVFKGKRPTGSL